MSKGFLVALTGSNSQAPSTPGMSKGKGKKDKGKGRSGKNNYKHVKPSMKPRDPKGGKVKLQLARNAFAVAPQAIEQRYALRDPTSQFQKLLQLVPASEKQLKVSLQAA
jgi:hypothetical protein